LADKRQHQVYLDNFEAGFAQGHKGIAGMIEAVIINKWGFDFTNLPQHFDIFSGDLDNSLKPELGAAMVEAMQDATFHLWSDRSSGRGHYAFSDKKCWTQFISSLTGS